MFWSYILFASAAADTDVAALPSRFSFKYLQGKREKEVKRHIAGHTGTTPSMSCQARGFNVRRFYPDILAHPAKNYLPYGIAIVSSGLRRLFVARFVRFQGFSLLLLRL